MQNSCREVTPTSASLQTSLIDALERRRRPVSDKRRPAHGSAHVVSGRSLALVRPARRARTWYLLIVLRLLYRDHRSVLIVQCTEITYSVNVHSSCLYICITRNIQRTHMRGNATTCTYIMGVRTQDDHLATPKLTGDHLRTRTRDIRTSRFSMYGESRDRP